MNLNSIFSFLAPKNNQFFDLFDKSAANLVELGKVLKEMMNSNNVETRNQLAKRIHELENVGDEFTHDILVELSKNFITPFDREDIHSLANSLDDVADYIYASGKKINFYKVNPNDPGIQKMADIIVQGVISVKNAVLELRNMKNMRNITDALVKVNSLENQADDIFDLSIEKLFDTEMDAKEVIKKREIYQILEIVTDKCEDVANVIETIVIKYA